MAINVAAVTHTHLSASPLAYFAAIVPSTTPATMNAATRFSSGMSTEPRARCPANDLSEVGRMMASVVPEHQVHADGRIDVEDAEDLVEHRDEHAAAANAEQPGEEAGDDPGDQQRGDQQRDLARRDAEIHGPAAAPYSAAASGRQAGSTRDTASMSVASDAASRGAFSLKWRRNTRARGSP